MIGLEILAGAAVVSYLLLIVWLDRRGTAEERWEYFCKHELWPKPGRETQEMVTRFRKELGVTEEESRDWPTNKVN